MVAEVRVPGSARAAGSTAGGPRCTPAPAPRRVGRDRRQALLHRREPLHELVLEPGEDPLRGVGLVGGDVVGHHHPVDRDVGVPRDERDEAHRARVGGARRDHLRLLAVELEDGETVPEGAPQAPEEPSHRADRYLPSPGGTFAADGGDAMVDAADGTSGTSEADLGLSLLPRGALRGGRRALRARAEARPRQRRVGGPARQGVGQRHGRGRRVRPGAALLRRRRAARAATGAAAAQPAEPPRRSALAPAALPGGPRRREHRRRGVRGAHPRARSELLRPGVDELVPQEPLPGHLHARLHAGDARPPQPEVDLSRRRQRRLRAVRTSPRRTG